MATLAPPGQETSGSERVQLIPWSLNKFQIPDLSFDDHGGQAEIIFMQLQDKLIRSTLGLPRTYVCKYFKTIQDQARRVQNEKQIYLKMMAQKDHVKQLPECAKKGKPIFDLYCDGEFKRNANTDLKMKESFRSFFILEGGALSLEKLIDNTIQPSIETRIWLFCQVVSIFACFDPVNTRFYHRDIKPANFVFGCRPGTDREANFHDLRVIDFGISQWDGQGGEFADKQLYLPPIEQNNKHPDKYDMYSMGYMLLVLLLWTKERATVSQMIGNIQKGLHVDLGADSWKVSDSGQQKQLLELLRGLLNLDPLGRIGWKELFQHILVKQYCNHSAKVEFTTNKMAVKQHDSTTTCLSEALVEVKIELEFNPECPLQYHGIFASSKAEIERILLEPDAANSRATDPLPPNPAQVRPQKTAPVRVLGRPYTSITRSVWSQPEENCRSNQLFDQSMSPWLLKFLPIFMADTAQLLHSLLLRDDFSSRALKSVSTDLLQVVFGLSTSAAAIHEQYGGPPLIAPNDLGGVERCVKGLLISETDPRQTMYLLTPEVLRPIHSLILGSTEDRHNLNASVSHQWQQLFVSLYLIVHWRTELGPLTLPELKTQIRALHAAAQPNKKSLLDHYLNKWSEEQANSNREQSMREVPQTASHNHLTG